MTTKQVNTPQYVLLNGKDRIGPKTPSGDSQACSSIIYGFSDKDPYDRFRSMSQLTLTPYPLVKGFLQRLIDEHLIDPPRDTVDFIAVDPHGPEDSLLNALTISSVLEAQKTSASHVPIDAQLTLDSATNLYHFDRVHPQRD